MFFAGENQGSSTQINRVMLLYMIQEFGLDICFLKFIV